MSREDENGVSRWWLREPVDHADAESDKGGDFVMHSEYKRVVDALKDELAGTIKVREQAFEKIAEMTAEITRLRAELERVRGQRDKALIDLAAKNHDILFADLPMAQCVTLADHGFRVLSYHGTRTVEEIES